MKKKYTNPIDNKLNKIISLSIIGIYGFLVLFAIISLTAPNWLKSASKIGKEAEARIIKGYGDQFLETGDNQMAITQFEKAVQTNPDFTAAYINLGIAYKNLGDLYSAFTFFKKALTNTNELHDVTYYHIAEIFERNGDLKNAIKYYLQSASLSPYPIFSYQKAGELLSNNKQFSLAFDAFDKAFENEFSMTNTYKGMLLKSFYIFNDENTKHEVKKLMAKDLSAVDFSTFDNQIFLEQEKFHDINATLFNQTGYIYIQTGKMDSARICFEKALQVKPDFINAKKNLDLVNSYLKR